MADPPLIDCSNRTSGARIYIYIYMFFFVARHKHLVVATQGAAHLPKEGAQGACMNSHAVGPRSKGQLGLQADRYKLPAARCPRMPTPGLGRPQPCPVDRRPQAVDTPQPEDFSSHNTPQGVHPSSNPVRGLSGLVRWARTPPGWQTRETDLWRRRPACISPFFKTLNEL